MSGPAPAVLAEEYQNVNKNFIKTNNTDPLFIESQ